MEKLQPGDYTTREEIEDYAKRADITRKEAYQIIRDAIVAGGACSHSVHADDLMSGDFLGWDIRDGKVYGWVGLTSGNAVIFTRHLTPEQILSAGKQEDVQSEKQATNPEAKKIAEMIVGEVFGKYVARMIANQIAENTLNKEPTEQPSQSMDELRDVGANGKPKQIGELTAGLNVELESDLQTIISDYMYLLDAIEDPDARGAIKSQLTDLTDLQYKQLNGENDNA